MLISGDVIELDLGLPAGREAGYRHPAVVVTSQSLLDADPNVVHVVPLTSSIRAFRSEVWIEPAPQNGLAQTSAAQCQHVRSISTSRIERVLGNIGSVSLAQVRELLGLILEIER